jgi:hypothetical protein
MNGEKVYVDSICGIDPNAETSCCDGNVQILKHSELVRALNAIFKQAEKNPDRVCSDLRNLVYNLNLLSEYNDHVPKVETVKMNAVKFDDPRKVKIVKQSKLQQERRVKYSEKSRVIKGGLYKPSDVSNLKVGDILSDTFKAWRKEEQRKAEQHNNAQ